MDSFLVRRNDQSIAKKWLGILAICAGPRRCIHAVIADTIVIRA